MARFFSLLTAPIDKQEAISPPPKKKKKKVTKNYSSVECGAKVIATNKEADHRSSVLNENKDSYMLNPCNVKGMTY